MKDLLRSVFSYSFALALLPVVLSGVTISGGFKTVIVGGLLLTIMTFVLKPIMTLFSLPFNIATLGFFSVITNALLLYLLTLFVPQISISAFTLHRIDSLGLTIPSVHLNQFFALCIASAITSLIAGFVSWISN